MTLSIFFKWLLLLHSSFFTPSTAKHVLHPYYVSITEINYNIKDKLIEISCKLFTNDLETDLRHRTKGYVDIVHPKDKQATSKLIADYISRNLQLNIDGRLYPLEYLGYEFEDEATWNYLQIKDVPAPKQIKIVNTLLYDYKKEQINMMHITVNNTRKSTKLENPESTANFIF